MLICCVPPDPNSFPRADQHLATAMACLSTLSIRDLKGIFLLLICQYSPVLLSGGRQQGALTVPGAVGRSGPFTPSRWNTVLWRVSKQRPSLLGKWGWTRQSAKTPWHCEKKYYYTVVVENRSHNNCEVGTEDSAVEFQRNALCVSVTSNQRACHKVIQGIILLTFHHLLTLP